MIRKKNIVSCCVAILACAQQINCMDQKEQEKRKSLSILIPQIKIEKQVKSKEMFERITIIPNTPTSEDNRGQTGVDRKICALLEKIPALGKRMELMHNELKSYSIPEDKKAEYVRLFEDRSTLMKQVVECLSVMPVKDVKDVESHYSSSKGSTPRNQGEMHGTPELLRDFEHKFKEQQPLKKNFSSTELLKHMGHENIGLRDFLNMDEELFRMKMEDPQSGLGEVLHQSNTKLLMLSLARLLNENIDSFGPGITEGFKVVVEELLKLRDAVNTEDLVKLRDAIKSEKLDMLLEALKSKKKNACKDVVVSCLGPSLLVGTLVVSLCTLVCLIAVLARVYAQP